jgi:hypothetical protein
MRKLINTWRIMAAGLVGAGALAACHDDVVTVPPAPTASATQIPFSVFAQQVYSNAANSTPVAVNSLNFDFDVNDDPTAFDGLIM